MAINRISHFISLAFQVFFRVKKLKLSKSDYIASVNKIMKENGLNVYQYQEILNGKTAYPLD